MAANTDISSAQSGDLYQTIIANHDIKVNVTNKYVDNFIGNIVTAIKDRVGEQLPKVIDLEFIRNNIVQALPQEVDKNVFETYVAEYLIVKSSYHYYYDLMASYIEVGRLHAITSELFLTTTTLMQNNIDANGDSAPILSDMIYKTIKNNHVRIQEALDYSRDYLFDYFGLKTLSRSYLSKLHFTKYKIIERPQHMIMRMAIGIHGNDIEEAIETYNLVSQKYFTHATPTLFNAGTPHPQLSSCFLMSLEDSIDDIYDGIKDMAKISKWSGGIGVHITSLRARGSLIRGTNGLASGTIPFAIQFNSLAKCVNQGGRRNGSIACYIEPWHPDIFDFCDLRKDTGGEDNRARDLFLGLWIPSLFMERVRNDEMWSLMCPDICKGLNEIYGQEFNKLYMSYEESKKYVRQVKARELWEHILATQSETGFPYMLYKDPSNLKSNQKNLGTIRSSNLCAEIIEYSDDKETAVCNLASICLPRYIKTDEKGNKIYDYEQLIRVSRVIVRNLNKIIDCNYYPTPKTKLSNMRHRPMGIGVQGLADVYNIMGYAFSSPEAYDINKRIFETIYYACIDESKELAKVYGSYDTFFGSPASRGELQFHMWGKSEDELLMGYDWKHLVNEVKTYGLRNSLLTALMPTASTSQIMGNSECFEPYMSNIFKRSTLAGEFIVVNKNLMRDLINLGLWDNDMRLRLIINNGSVQNIKQIPENIREIYKTAFEMGQKHLVRQSADRGIFIDQSQSLNLFMKEPDFDILTAALFDGHDLGLKTGMYYYRSMAAINPISFGIDIKDIKRLTEENDDFDLNMDDFVQDKEKKIIEVPEVKKGYCKWKPGMKLEDCLSCGS
jgi:ribonucleoside-diphosphate reductase alpha chain